jgi:hypothetical protein
MRLTLLAILAAAAVSPAAPAQVQAADPWKQIDFLLGKWTGAAGEKDTPLGVGQGEFSFEPELNRHIIVRRNNASYTSGVTHDDLMIIYLDPPNAPPRAIYFDTEGHVIRYALAFPAANRVVFESDAGPPGPQYRLTYWLEGASLHGRFEVAGKTYMTWTSRKR